MTTLSDLFSHADFVEALDGGLISAQTHPTLPLVIYNYTPNAAYSRSWNDVTRTCRGLICDLDGNVIARPFEKFFNYAEVDQYDGIPAGDPIVSEKMDGSLGIIYTYTDPWTGYPHIAVATRGSFASDQALWATDWLHENMPDFTQPDGVTTLVEVIYPANRIVVDYQGAEGLWLLGAIDNATGADIDVGDITWWNGPKAPQYPWTTDKALASISEGVFDNEEGVVLTWPRQDAPSFRLKAKSLRYIELHRIVTNLSTRSVHEALASGTFADLVAVTPDEFHPWVKKVASSLMADHGTIFNKTVDDLDRARRDAGVVSTVDGYTRKDLAMKIQANATYPGLCFALEDGKDIAPRIWDMIRPAREMAIIEA